jgi:pyruvate dehydrogenase E2 component (dihydrolipoyllysine-residue acetyltransferase)
VARPIVMPSLGMYTAEGTLVEWLRPFGARVRSGEPVAEITTEKASFEIVAPEDGILHPVAPVGTNLSVEGLMGYILAEGEQPPTSQSEGPPSASSPRVSQSQSSDSASPSPPEVRASPAARRLAAGHKIDLGRVKGSGPAGRIIEADVLAAISRTEAPSGSEKGSLMPRVRDRSPLTAMRRAIADRLGRSLGAAVSLTLTREAQANALVVIQSRLAPGGDKSFPLDALFIKLLAAALRDHPELNATIEGDTLLCWEDIHIGFAVAVPGGLVVPVIRHADKESLAKISSMVRDLRKRALEGSLHPKDLAGGTATITNLGAYGVDAFTPILNPPESAILGVGRIMERPVISGGSVVPAHTCVLSLTFDHRVTDGAPAALLLQSVADRMDDEEYLLSLVAS